MFGWKPKRRPGKPDWQRLFAHVCQNYGVRPHEIGLMTEVEVLLYLIPPQREATDPFTASVVREAVENLSIEDRIRLGRTKYRLDTV